MAVQSTATFSWVANESSTLDLGSAAMAHRFAFSKDFSTGTGDSQHDVAWSDTRSVESGTPDDLDLRGTLTGALGNTISNVEIVGLAIKNNSTTLGQYLTVGGDGSAVYSGMFGAANDTITVQPGGLFVWLSTLDGGGLATTAGSADVLQVAAATGTISYSILVLGRSA